MKERITMQRLMQEGWIPILIGILSASVIVSLAHSTSMAYVTAFLLLTLYFVAIAANRVNARTIVAVTAKWILQRAVENIGEILRIMALDSWRGKVLSRWSMLLEPGKSHIEQSVASLIDRLAGLGVRVESMLLAFIVSTGRIDSGGHVELLKTGKIALGRLIQVIKSSA